MSNLCIYLPLEDYLAQWFVNEHGGEVPVHLTRGSVESKTLELYMAKLPEGVEPEVCADGKLAVRIPTFRNRPPETYVLYWRGGTVVAASGKFEYICGLK